MAKKSICILVDDDDDDLLIFRRTLEQCFSTYSFIGIQSFGVLKEYFSSVDLSAEIVLFLDLNIPKANGLEILKWMKQQARLKDIKTVIYSTSKNPNDKRSALELGACGFISKPSTIEKLVEDLKSFL